MMNKRMKVAGISKKSFVHNKKSQVITFYDMTAWCILILGMIIWTMIFMNEAAEKKAIKEEIDMVGQDSMGLSLMRTEIDGKTLSRHLLYYYSNNDPEGFIEKVDAVFSLAYDEEICWKIYVDEMPFALKKCKTEPFIDSTFKYPMMAEGKASSKEIHILAGYPQ